ncbi:MAG: hypothetical protein ACLSXC_08385 [Beduini sp.]
MKKILNGRYGFDLLGQFIVMLSLILSMLSLLLKIDFLYFVSLALLIYELSRAFSKKIYARRQENLKFASKLYPYQVKAMKFIQRQQDKKTHKYFKCPKCKQMLRVPLGHGKITVTCPKCHHQFDKRS